MKKDNFWLFLSYELSPKLSSYGNGQRIIIESLNKIKKGKSCNTTLLKIPSHVGTHIDYPYHFSESGTGGSSYEAREFVFKNVRLIEIYNEGITDFLIRPCNIFFDSIDYSTTLLLIKTNFCKNRNSEAYWNENWGFAPDTASFFKKNIPNLRAIGFDLISLSSFQKRDIGRKAHNEFLINNNILIIEDMDLTQVSKITSFSQVIIAPLRFEDADGSPVTIFAEITNGN